jgi:dTDP-4-amino-4,6-dideoxygalactose transaminase
VIGQPEPNIPFNRPSSTGRELDAVAEAVQRGHLAADGSFSQRCAALLEQTLGAESVLLVHSCTAALELAALLLKVGPGDEIIMPSFTFVTTAAAFALRGATPVFIDIRPDTLNIDETLIEQAITDRTRAIVAVHYAGVGCAMESLVASARDNGLALVEDAAQGWGARYKGAALGTFGDLGALSFHETKNVTSGHGGALIVNSRDLGERAQILRDKGTNRFQFMHGQVDKYTWVDLGSSYAISDLAAAFLWPQLQDGAEITARRVEAWNRYHSYFADAEQAGLLRRPVIPDGCEHNAHMYYLLLPDTATRDALIERLAEKQISAVFHFVPLHSSPAGRRYGRVASDMGVTNDLSSRLLRVPLWTGIAAETIDRVASTTLAIVEELVGTAPSARS